jgi:uncharacterized membrane protein YjdF
MMKQLLAKSNMQVLRWFTLPVGRISFFTIKTYIIIFMSGLHYKYAKIRIDIYRLTLDEYVNITGM